MLTVKHISILSVVTAVAVGAAAVAATARYTGTIETITSEKAFPGFAEKLENIQQIDLIRAEDSATGTVSIVRAGEGWEIEQRDGYPARTELIRRLLSDVSDLDIVEAKTKDIARLHRLHLTDVAQDGSNSVRLVVIDQGGETLLDSHFGKQRDSISGSAPMTYLRDSGESQSYLAEGELDLRQGPVDWLFREVINVKADNIREAVLTAPDGHALTITRDKQGERDFTTTGLGENREPRSKYAPRNAATALDKLIFQDVRAAKGLTFSGAGSALYKTYDGLDVTVTFAEVKSDGDKPEVWTTYHVAPSSDAPDEAKLKALNLNKKLAGWAFKLSDDLTGRMRETAETLGKDKKSS